MFYYHMHIKSEGQEEENAILFERQSNLAFLFPKGERNVSKYIAIIKVLLEGAFSKYKFFSCK